MTADTLFIVLISRVRLGLALVGRPMWSVSALACALVLAACGGGGDSPVTNLPVSRSVAAVSGPDVFALFPNPLLDLALSDPTDCADLQVLVSCYLQSDEEAYATAYYAAIDPDNDKDTLAKWKTANGFDNGPSVGVGPLGEVSATLGDAHDLGYGRRMTGRQNANGTLAFYVENFNVDVGAGYGDIALNTEAAARRDMHWFIGTNAIEFSPGPLASSGPTRTVSFAKFYTFDPVTGARLKTVDLDGRGRKAMPSLCVNCHGGRADPLTPTGLFPRVENSTAAEESPTLRGDLTAKLQPFKVSEFQFFNRVVNGVDYSRDGQEAKFKKLNEMVLCSYPKASGVDEPNCYDIATSKGASRPAAGVRDWQGDTAETLIRAYGGTLGVSGLPNSRYSDAYVPSAWSSNTDLYNKVVKPYCITCHGLRGVSYQRDINFLTYSRFEGYAPYIKKHVFERGNMPLARLVYQNFWADANNAPKVLADWLSGVSSSLAVTRDANGKPLQPGAPVADPGPDRVTRNGVSTTLSARQSQFATSFRWAFSSNPGSAATLDGGSTSTAQSPVFRATADGTYVLNLTASNAAGDSSTKSLTIVVNSTIADPTLIRFSHIDTILQAQCSYCHLSGGGPPIFYDSTYDRSGTGIPSTNTSWLYAEVKGRINFTDVAASPLLRKPAGHHHGGGKIFSPPDYSDDLTPGATARAYYDTFLNWILNGAPE